MPKKLGPWGLNEVKTRLRAEQVKREKAASERYRQQEEGGQDTGSKGVRNCSECLLIVVVLCCFLLSLSVLALSSVILAQARK